MTITVHDLLALTDEQILALRPAEAHLRAITPAAPAASPVP